MFDILTSFSVGLSPTIADASEKADNVFIGNNVIIDDGVVIDSDTTIKRWCPYLFRRDNRYGGYDR
ncbi:MAG: hypothetical protein IID58_10235 [Proteobacteria bacterium]|nr:hypothetical protein [Pseudomonadota bacterium]